MAGSLFAVLIDLSGTVYDDDAPIGAAIEAVNRLRRNPRARIRFVTNTTKESISRLHARLVRIGFTIDRDEIFTSLTAAKRFVLQHQLRPMLLLEDVAAEDFEGINRTNPNAVVVGLAPSQLNAERMNEAFRLIQGGAQLVAVYKARYCKRPAGLALGPGPFIQALEYAADTKATVVGKPEKGFFLYALESLEAKISPERCVMIGDGARDDIQGAVDAGMIGILVKTGKYRPGDELTIEGGAFLCDDIAAAVELIERQLFL
uniref:Haloacid dehalogenase-like hydrolase domain-containing protein 2 n=1 Tax=Plectus sambesii TaxID=2011161 RepID=A0A914W991_9BILA